MNVNDVKNRIGTAAGHAKQAILKNTFLFTIVFIIVIIFVVYYLVLVANDFRSGLADAPYLIRGTRTGTKPLKVNANKIKPSIDGQYGVEFAYSFWLWIDDVSFEEGNNKRWKHIFHKGNDSSIPLQAPGVWLYPDENKLSINMNTFSNVKQSCDVGNIPLNKWVHITIVVLGGNMDVYINKNLKKRCKLEGVPRQNYGDLFVTKWGGMGGGFISELRYFNRALDYYEIEREFNRGPSNAPCTETGAQPPYFANNWWLTTGFPNSTDTV